MAALPSLLVCAIFAVLCCASSGVSINLSPSPSQTSPSPSHSFTTGSSNNEPPTSPPQTSLPLLPSPPPPPPPPPPSPSPTVVLRPDGSVVENPPITYGNLTCEPYTAGGYCQPFLNGLMVVTNFSRSTQEEAVVPVDSIIQALTAFASGSDPQCVEEAVPLFCQYSFPPCDPAFDIPVYQRICRWDCEVMQEFYCSEVWEEMLQLLPLLDLGVIDVPNCGPLEYSDAGNAPTCISTLDGGELLNFVLTGDCYSGSGVGYQGTVNATASGLPCQVWTRQVPHRHLLSPSQYPELSGDHNYCRNPGQRGEQPWCFTASEGTRWEYCNVPSCEPGPICERLQTSDLVCYRASSVGLNYLYMNTSVASADQYNSALQKINSSRFEPNCKRHFLEMMCAHSLPSCDLSSSVPIPHLLCRSYCERVNDICKDDIDTLMDFQGVTDLFPLTVPDCADLPNPNGGEAPECYDEPVAMPDQSIKTEDCYNTSDGGLTYAGTVNTTASGKPCQPWDSHWPHAHPLSSLYRPYLQDINYCRNPESRGERPWCYTTDPHTRWEYCDVPACSSGSSFYVIIVAMPAAVGGALLLLVVTTLLCCCCCACCRGRKRRKRHCIKNGGGGDSPPLTKLLSMQTITVPGGGRGDPLYTCNPTATSFSDLQQDSSDGGGGGGGGIKLPQFPRSRLVYLTDLGQGQFGMVVKAAAEGIMPGEDKTMVAIKVLKEGSTPQDKKEFFREATLLCSFDHPNIVKLLGVCIEQEPLCMIFEYMELGDLNNLLKGCSLGELKDIPVPCQSTQGLVNIAIDIAAGLEYLAQNHYVHRDLATRNCLVAGNYKVKISDFGLSQDIYTKDYFRLGDSELLPIRWMPPESILYARFTVQSDVWSFGVVLWEVFSIGRQPYYGMTNEEVVQHVQNGNVMNCPEGCPPEIYDLMVDCWSMVPDDRPTATDIHAGLKRWTPDMAAQAAASAAASVAKNPDYQNMATVKEYAQQQPGTIGGGGGGGGDTVVGGAGGTASGGGGGIMGGAGDHMMQQIMSPQLEDSDHTPMLN